MASEPQEEVSPATTPVRRTPGRRAVAKRTNPPRRRVPLQDFSQTSQEEASTQSQLIDEEEEEKEEKKPSHIKGRRRKKEVVVEDQDVFVDEEMASLQVTTLTAPPSQGGTTTTTTTTADMELMELLVGMPPLKRKKKEKVKETGEEEEEEELSPAALEWKRRYEEAARQLEGMDGMKLRMDVLEGKLHETEGELALRTRQLVMLQERCRELEQQLGEPHTTITILPRTLETDTVVLLSQPVAEVEEQQQPQQPEQPLPQLEALQEQQTVQVSEDAMQVEGATDEESRKRKRQQDEWCTVQ